MASSYLDYVGESLSDSELSQLQKLAEQQAALGREVKLLEAQLESVRESYRDVSERRIPELMDQFGLEDFTTTTGLKIKVGEVIRASITKTKAPEAFSWLRSSGHAALIKKVVSIPFGVGQEEEAEELLQTLGEQEYSFGVKEAVHPSTLSAFVREKLADGEELPLDLLGVHRQRVAKIETTK